MPKTAFTRELASNFARIALDNVGRRYPYKLEHMMSGPDDLAGPEDLHPVFCSSYDWHSSVHMHWLLVRMLGLVPDLDAAPRIRAVLDANLTPAGIEAELAYLQHPAAATFERPYGWAWVLRLQAELDELRDYDSAAARWADACAPLATYLAGQLAAYLDIADFPIRAGTHANSAFALLMAWRYARTDGHAVLRRAIVRRAHRWFGHDQHYPARYEPGGDDFLSGGLMEAALMQAVTERGAFAEWWQLFSPSEADLATWLVPVCVTDRRDPKMTHLDGLNLSRAWCWRLLEPSLPEHLRPWAISAWSDHLEASLAQATEAGYASTHWLATFALLALTEARG